MVTRRFVVVAVSVCAAFLMTAAHSRAADTKGKSRRSSAREAAAPAGEATESTPAGAAPGGTGAAESSAAPTEVVIHRRRLHFRAPEKYQVSMHLDPARTIRLAAPFDGTVKTMLQKPGQRVDSGTEIIRMDPTEKQLRLDRAKALFNAAKLENERAASEGNSPIARQLADARLQAAKADLDLAVYWMEQGAVRAPFNCEIFATGVSEGQVVRMGDPLVTIGDTATLKVELPVDRTATKAGQAIEVKVEDRTASGVVEVILPLASRFEPLRDLVPSAASAILVFQNADGRLKAGQTVFSPLVPRDPIADVPNSAIGNLPDGTHKVQVLRDSVIRDIPIATLAAVGPDRSFVSGAFDPSDEIIESTSQELVDGTVVRSSPPAPVAAAKPGNPAVQKTPAASGSPESPPRRAAGF